MSDTEICRRPGHDRRTTEQNQEALLLAAFRCAGKRERIILLRQAINSIHVERKNRGRN